MGLGLDIWIYYGQGYILQDIEIYTTILLLLLLLLLLPSINIIAHLSWPLENPTHLFAPRSALWVPPPFCIVLIFSAHSVLLFSLQ